MDKHATIESLVVEAEQLRIRIAQDSERLRDIELFLQLAKKLNVMTAASPVSHTKEQGEPAPGSAQGGDTLGVRSKGPLLRFEATQGVDELDVNALIGKIWGELRSRPDVILEAEKFGIDKQIFLSATPPFEARGDGSQFGIGTTILIFLGIEVSKAIIDRGVNVLWDEFFAPQLNTHMGGKLELQ
jgi:hypothetical protein